MQTMYPGIVNSPITEISSAITASQTSITLLNGAALPAAPNIAVIGQGDNAETILYTSKSGNTISGVTRGFQGTAQSWALGTKVARNFTAYDYEAMRGNIDEKLDKNNPVYTGELIGPTVSTGTKFSKHLGQKSTIPNSPHQKLDIEIPKGTFRGYIDINITGSWSNANFTGKLTKRFALAFSDTGTINSQNSRYVEAIGGIINYLSIGDLFFDSGKNKFIIKISYRTVSVTSETIDVFVDGMYSLYGAPLKSIAFSQTTSFYADSEVYPSPVVSWGSTVALNGNPPVSNVSNSEVPNWNSGLHHGWRRYNTLAELGLSSNATIADIYNAMPYYSILVLDGTFSFLPTGATDASFKFEKITFRLTGECWAHSKKYGGYATEAANWIGWKNDAFSDGLLQTNLNAERTNGIKMFNSLTTPVGAANGDLYFPPPTT